MKKEWFAAKELVDLGGLPGTAQGVNQRAKREKLGAASASRCAGKSG